MGVVCSCLAGTFLLLGEVCSTLFLAIGEVGAMLLRGLFSLLVGLCDVLAACACCCRVPFSERPDRSGYTYSTLALRTDAPSQHRFTDKPKFSAKSFTKHTQLFSVPAVKRARSAKAASASADTSAVTQEADDSVATTAILEDVAKTSTESEKVAQPEVQSGWFSAFFGNSKPAVAA